ncbi:Protein downstream neighbor of son like [Pseudolycoriella hygida]|uniref:Protein downstream neighbor of son like n=1 Tax=Pseudolycoriella hygida TaxID=35572 RepID=A0A9Q0N364_9DIPT|nr:Protein downstream neighbor of son like [Pseudolycoriella hygida]
MADFKWKTPDEIIRLRKDKQKQKALQLRTLSTKGADIATAVETFAGNKRKNPFIDKRSSIGSKRLKTSPPITYEPIESIFSLIEESEPFQIQGVTQISKYPTKTESYEVDPNQVTFSFNSTEIEEKEKQQVPTKYLPVDWSLKTKLRILCPTAFHGKGQKISGASGITSFVRCMDPKTASIGLDFSPGARFHHSTLYWQHPSLPWLTLYPRNVKSNTSCSFGETERTALMKDWSDSFQSLFQLLRARHCPYFYCCANGFTVLFRAAGIGGRVETHALLTPTSSGLRAALKQESIEFTLPMKVSTDNVNRSNPDIYNHTSSTSETQDSGCVDELDDDNFDDDDQEEWLASMGVDAAEIKKIRTVQSRVKQSDERKEDYSDQSIALFEGVDCQALFNFLLNAKSTTATVGKLAGIPPTLLAPVAFRGATLRNVEVNSGKVRMENRDYFSLELKGVILPHIMQYLCNLLRETKDVFSISTFSQPSTLSFSKAAHLMNEESLKEHFQMSDQVFGQRNLSDCGLPYPILETLCRVSNDAVRNIERMCYNKESGGYTWN